VGLKVNHEPRPWRREKNEDEKDEDKKEKEKEKDKEKEKEKENVSDGPRCGTLAWARPPCSPGWGVSSRPS
jgi:hypothetical protein